MYLVQIAISIVLFALIPCDSYAQGYSTTSDTFYVSSPEYSSSLGIDSLHFPCAITTPNSGTNFPVLILVHGSSALDKDASSTKDYLDSIGANYRKAETYMFKEIADSLSNNGIVVLRYDKRSYTLNCIEKPACWFVDTISPYDYINDIHHAIDYTKSLPQIDTCNIFLAGHSQGGSFASLVGFDREDIRGVLNMAGTALPIDSVVINQIEFIDSDPIGANIIRQQFDSLRNGLWPMTDTLYSNHYSPRFWLDWISHTDSAMLVQKESNKPTALMYGAADRFLSASIHFQAWQDSVSRPNVTFQLFNEIDHVFGTEYDSTMSPAVLNFMTDWILSTSEDCIPSSVSNTNENNDGVFYPNPVNDILYITYSKQSNVAYEIIDMNGRLIKNGLLSQNTSYINLSTLAPGSYFLKTGESVKKLIKY